MTKAELEREYFKAKARYESLVEQDKREGYSKTLLRSAKETYERLKVEYERADDIEEDEEGSKDSKGPHEKKKHIGYDLSEINDVVHKRRGVHR